MARIRTAILLTLVGLSSVCLHQLQLFAQPQPQSQPLSAETFRELKAELKNVQTELSQLSQLGPTAWADAAIFAKGLEWGLKYDSEFSTADVALLNRAVTRCRSRLAHPQVGRQPWSERRGKLALAYRSQVDGSVQPYGLIVPKLYDATKPIRLDVVLHGSLRPVGMSELRFLGRFDLGDEIDNPVPDQPFIELHPLGRVENCYRWSGETDVWEAIEDVSRRYRIDRDRIVLRGMSMGASGTWHLGLKHPDRFVALGPYCGYVDTHRISETPIGNFVRVGPLPDHQELALHMLDSVDYAANAGVVPAIACMGEKDVFFQAHVIMGAAMEREGLTMVNLISPGTGHVIDPQTHAEQMRRIGEIAERGLNHEPQELRFVTWTLKYNRCHWIELRELEQHYARAEITARKTVDRIEISAIKNITRFALRCQKQKTVQINSQVFDLSPPELAGISTTAVFLKRGDLWVIDNLSDESTKPSKRPGLQGPIDDAFTTPFLCVRGTGTAWNRSVQAYADASLARFAHEWHHYFRGELPIKSDLEVTDDDVRNKNLILFGDPGSNAWIAKVLPHLPVAWTKEKVKLGGTEHSASQHVPALIHPNPLAPAGNRYIVINSGHTFREAELAKLNYLLFPRWGDWAMLRIDEHRLTDLAAEETVIRAGFFNEQWK